MWFTETVFGIEERDPKRWPDSPESKWRCLKVRWDETLSIRLPERVSPWKIEPALVPPAINTLPVHRQKRPRSNMLPSSPDSSVVTKEALLLTVSGAYKNKYDITQVSCRTDRAGIISVAPWIRVPYSFQWGAPTFDAGEAFAMRAASFVSLIEGR